MLQDFVTMEELARRVKLLRIAQDGFLELFLYREPTQKERELIFEAARTLRIEAAKLEELFQLDKV